MPCIHIETKAKNIDKQKIIEAVDNAFISGFKTTSNDNVIRLSMPEFFKAPANKSNPEVYTIVSIDAFSGRTQELKDELFSAIKANLEPLGIPNDCVKIILRESDKLNWA